MKARNGVVAKSTHAIRDKAVEPRHSHRSHVLTGSSALRMKTRFARVAFAVVILLVLAATTSYLHSSARAQIDPLTGELYDYGNIPTKGTAGGVIMSKLGNETAKAELGRSTWRLLHTMTLRYPEHPTTDERDALQSYMILTSRLYPCGECAAEFQALLRKYPPQTSSRRAAALWLCFVHNQVNARLGKPEFDCNDLDGTYDCGCGDAPIASNVTAEATLVAGGRK